MRDEFCKLAFLIAFIGREITYFTIFHRNSL